MPFVRLCARSKVAAVYTQPDPDLDRGLSADQLLTVYGYPYTPTYYLVTRVKSLGFEHSLADARVFRLIEAGTVFVIAVVGSYFRRRP